MLRYFVWVVGSEKEPRRHRSYGIAGCVGSLLRFVLMDMVTRVWSEVQWVASKSLFFIVLAVVLHCSVLALPMMWSVIVLSRQVGCWVSTPFFFASSLLCRRGRWAGGRGITAEACRT